MHFLSFLLLFYWQVDVPNRLCLPIQVKAGSPIEFALNTLKEGLKHHDHFIELSCSQPDYQLFFSVDKSLRNSDDFILIISDVNVEISGGSERGVMYGILDFLQQLEANKYQISKVRSVVSHPNTKVRGLLIDHDQMDGIFEDDCEEFLNAMVSLRFNHLVIKSKSNVEGTQSVDKIKHLAKVRGIDFDLEGKPEDLTSRKGLVVNSGTVSRRLPSSSIRRLGNEPADFERFANQSEIPAVLIDAGVDKVHNFSNWHQVQWCRFFADRQRVPQRVLLDCTNLPLKDLESQNFLTRYHRYFVNWRQQLEQPIDFAPADALLPQDQCVSGTVLAAIQAAEKAALVLYDCLSSKGHWFDWRTFRRFDKMNQGQFCSVQLILENEERREQHKNGNDDKMPLRAVVDSLKQWQTSLNFMENFQCDHNQIDFLIRDLNEFAASLPYAIHKLESVCLLSKFRDTRRRSYKAQAISHTNLASEFWRVRWSPSNMPFMPRGLSRDEWIHKAEEEAAMVRKLKNR